MRRHIITTIALGAGLLWCPAARAQAPVPYGGSAYASMYGGMNYPSAGMSSYGYGMYYADPVTMVLQIRQGIAALEQRGNAAITEYTQNPYGIGNGGATGNVYQPYANDSSNVYQPLGGKESKKLQITIDTKEPGDALLKGLSRLADAALTIRPGDVVNVRKNLNDKQLQNLIQSVGADEQAGDNARQLTQLLQTRGLLRAGERVVGVAGGKVYATFVPWR